MFTLHSLCFICAEFKKKPVLLPPAATVIAYEHVHPFLTLCISTQQWTRRHWCLPGRTIRWRVWCFHSCTGDGILVILSCSIIESMFKQYQSHPYVENDYLIHLSTWWGRFASPHGHLFRPLLFIDCTDPQRKQGSGEILDTIRREKVSHSVQCIIEHYLLP